MKTMLEFWYNYWPSILAVSILVVGLVVDAFLRMRREDAERWRQIADIQRQIDEKQAIIDRRMATHA